MDLGFLFQLLLIAGVIAGVVYLLYWTKTGGLGKMFTRGAMGMFTGPAAQVASSLGVPTDPSGAIEHVVGAGGGAAVDASHVGSVAGQFVQQVGSGISNEVTNVPEGAYVENTAGQITNSAGNVVGTAASGLPQLATDTFGSVAQNFGL